MDILSTCLSVSKFRGSNTCGIGVHYGYIINMFVSK